MTRLPADLLRLPVAHRALHDRAAGRPENSRAAVRAAVAAGYAIEIDLQLSADGFPMVIHDDTLDRLTEATGPVSARSAAELGQIRLKDAPDGVPMLQEVLSIVAGRVPLLIEIKDQDGALGPKVGPLETVVAETLFGYGGPVAVMSFNPHSMAHMQRLAPALPRGLITCAFPAEEWEGVPEARLAELRGIPDYDAVEACFISHQARDLADPRVAALKAQGAAILCWTVRSATAEAEARRIADTITFEGYEAAIPD